MNLEHAIGCRRPGARQIETRPEGVLNQSSFSANAVHMHFTLWVFSVAPPTKTRKCSVIEAASRPVSICFSVFLSVCLLLICLYPSLCIVRRHCYLFVSFVSLSAGTFLVGVHLARPLSETFVRFTSFCISVRLSRLSLSVSLCRRFHAATE